MEWSAYLEKTVAYIRIGGKIYFDANDIEALLLAHKELMVPGEKKRKRK